jgi:hypothetical protein
LDHSLSSAAADLASNEACFRAAASAFYREEESALAARWLPIVSQMLKYLGIASGLPGILAAFLAAHDDQVGGDVHYDKNADERVDGIGAHSMVVGLQSK